MHFQTPVITLLDGVIQVFLKLWIIGSGLSSSAIGGLSSSAIGGLMMTEKGIS